MAPVILTIVALIVLFVILRRLPVAGAVATARIRKENGGYEPELVRDQLSGADRVRLLTYLEEQNWEGPCTITLKRSPAGVRVQFGGHISDAQQQRVRNFVINSLNVK